MKRATKPCSIRPLAACLLVTLGGVCGTPGLAQGPAWHPIPHRLPTLPANAIPVTNCNDSGPGSLRQASVAAANGDTIDLTAVGCSLITLTSGAITLTQNAITLQGPGAGALVVSGNDQTAVLIHDGRGTLAVNDLTIAHGMKYSTPAQIGNARGGCIFSSGTVSLNSAQVEYCTAKKLSSFGAYFALGGAVYAANGAVVSYSRIADSQAIATGGSNWGRGGGLYSTGLVTVSHSVITGNYSSLDGGGIFSRRAGVEIKYSTVSNNVAAFRGGAMVDYGGAQISESTISNNAAAITGGLILISGFGGELSITESTISGNTAHSNGGIYLSYWNGGTIANSTIAFNASDDAAGGMLCANASGSSIDLESSIFADNTNYAGDFDIQNCALSGANNLIRVADGAVPAGTNTSDPLLGPLRANGGPTLTHALGFRSPALNAGNDVMGFAFDQRGTGFSRSLGSGPDIGALESNFLFGRSRRGSAAESEPSQGLTPTADADR